MLGWISVLYLQMLPRAPLLLKYTMQDCTGKEEVAARGLFCSLWVGCLGCMNTGLNFGEASCSFPNQWRPLLSFTRETKELIDFVVGLQLSIPSILNALWNWRFRLKNPNLLWDLDFSSSFIITWLNTWTVWDQRDHRAHVRWVCSLGEFVDGISFLACVIVKAHS